MRYEFLGTRLFLGFCAIATCAPFAVEAAEPAITYRYQHHIFTIDPDTYPAWETEKEVWTYRSMTIVPPAILRVDGDTVPPLPEGFAKSLEPAWDKEAIKRTITEKIAVPLHREAGSVTIKRSASGAIVFDGVGMTGREVDVDLASRSPLLHWSRMSRTLHCPSVKHSR